MSEIELIVPNIEILFKNKPKDFTISIGELHNRNTLYSREELEKAFNLMEHTNKYVSYFSWGEEDRVIRKK